MHGLSTQLHELEAIATLVTSIAPPADVLLCVPATLIERAVSAIAGGIGIGGQDCHAEISGSFTGDISAQMLKDAGASSVIVGHSERRLQHGETDAMVAAKAQAAWAAGLFVIVCIGETQAQREAGKALLTCRDQLANSLPAHILTQELAIAYEPLWAIGSGHIPSDEHIIEMHTHIRHCLEIRLGSAGKNVRILYGGSVDCDNVGAILALAEVNGALMAAQA